MRIMYIGTYHALLQYKRLYPHATGRNPSCPQGTKIKYEFMCADKASHMHATDIGKEESDLIAQKIIFWLIIFVIPFRALGHSVLKATSWENEAILRHHNLHKLYGDASLRPSHKIFSLHRTLCNLSIWIFRHVYAHSWRICI